MSPNVRVRSSWSDRGEEASLLGRFLATVARLIPKRMRRFFGERFGDASAAERAGYRHAALPRRVGGLSIPCHHNHLLFAATYAQGARREYVFSGQVIKVIESIGGPHDVSSRYLDHLEFRTVLLRAGSFLYRVASLS